jgi:hypothetical protein
VFKADEWNQMIVGYHNGAPVRIRDIGRAVAGVEDNQSGEWTFAG